MPKYECRLGTAQGDVVVEEFLAPDEGILKSQLQDKGYFVFSITPKTAWLDWISYLIPQKKTVSMKDFVIFNQEFAALLRAGLPVLMALDILLSRKGEDFFSRVLNQIRDEVKSGNSLSEAFKNHGKAFPTVYPATLAAGERSGELVSVIERYLFFMRTLMTIRKKIISAIIYPIILLVLSIGLIVLLLVFIVPKFASLFQGSGAELPLLTRAVLGLSSFMQYSWPLLVALVAAAVIAMRVSSHKPRFKLLLDGIRLKMPLLGKNIRRYNLAQMTRTLGTLVAGGIPVVTALDVVADAMSNEVYRVDLRQVKEWVMEGEALWESLEKTRMVTPLAVEMIQVGEATGSLAEMLEQVSQFYDEQLSTAVERLVALIEPALLLFMAIVIALVVLSVYMPLFEMYNIMGQ